MNLTEIYKANRDIRESEIPDKWKESFDQFITGNTCSAELNEDGTLKEYIYYATDFRRWYLINQIAIERDIAMEFILDN